MKESSDNDILKMLARQETSSEGFVELMRRYREPLYWHIRRLVVSHEDSQDILQESFINIHRYIGKFKGDSSLKTWLYKIATNEAIRHTRRNRLFVRSYDENSRLVELFESDPTIDFSTMEAKLQRLVLELPPKQRVVFNLRYYENMDYEQIAEVTEQSVASLKTNYHYAITKIKRSIL